MNREEAVKQVEEGLTFLILNHSHCVASEQYTSNHDEVETDEYIKEHQQWVIQLRRIRQVFENLVTGLIERREVNSESID